MSTRAISTKQRLPRQIHVLLFALSLSVAACSKTPAAKTDEFAEVKAAAPAATVSAETLAAAYSDNALAAEAQYSGKVLEVTGRFLLNQKATTDAGPEVWYAALSAGNTKGSMALSMFVHCFFNSDDSSVKKQFAALKNGDTVRVKGKATQQRAFEVELRGCTLL